MDVGEIAKEITLKAMEKNKINIDTQKTYAEYNEKIAKEISKFYKIVYKAAKEAEKGELEDIYIGDSK